MTSLADLTWTEVEARAASSDLMICLGSLEQHGPHLPLDTDSVIMAELARRWARQRPDRLVTPVVPLGASGEHAAFPGTISIGTDATAGLVVEAIRSGDCFRNVVVASWHGGNADALAQAAAALGTGDRVEFWRPMAQGDAHAGRTETSMMLAIAPERVRMDARRAGNTAPIEFLMSTLRSGGVRAVSPNGVLGDPRGATVEEGEAALAAIVEAYEATR